MTTNIASLIIVLGVLVFFHELGHFLVARFFGVGVEKFSLGFGPRVFGKKIGMTEYLVSAIPLGGYVKMVGEDPGADVDPRDKSLSFIHKPVSQRILIVAAGPLFNFILAVLIYAGLFMANGIQDLNTVVGKLDENSPAVEAGLRTGDRIVKVDGETVELWSDVSKKFLESNGRPLQLTVMRNDSTFSARMTPKLSKHKNIFGEEEEVHTPGFIPLQRALIGRVENGSPAYRAGLRAGDLIRAIDGEEIVTWTDLVSHITESKGAEIAMDIARGDSVLPVRITPEILDAKGDRYRIGIAPHLELVKRELGFVACFTESVSKTAYLTKIMLVGVGKMITGSIPRSDLGGPIIIAKMAGDQARVGLDSLINFIAFISINLAILNFLPIPVLDGGHIFFFMIEAIMRRPVKTETREVAQQVGMFLLLFLMVFVFYNDIMRVFFR